jgi:hypothetical protein
LRACLRVPKANCPRDAGSACTLLARSSRVRLEVKIWYVFQTNDGRFASMQRRPARWNFCRRENQKCSTSSQLPASDWWCFAHRRVGPVRLETVGPTLRLPLPPRFLPLQRKIRNLRHSPNRLGDCTDERFRARRQRDGDILNMSLIVDTLNCGGAGSGLLVWPKHSRGNVQ